MALQKKLCCGSHGELQDPYQFCQPIHDHKKVSELKRTPGYTGNVKALPLITQPIS